MAKPTQRQRRVADQLREVISEVIRDEVVDNRLNGVTVMDVTIDRELEVAEVYVNCIRGEQARPEVESALSKAAGFMRREVGQRVRLRHTPELRFHWDVTLSEADRIETLLSGLNLSRQDQSAEGLDEHNK